MFMSMSTCQGPHLDGADLLAAPIDELLEAPRQREEAVPVQEALVPRVEPAACAIMTPFGLV